MFLTRRDMDVATTTLNISEDVRCDWLSPQDVARELGLCLKSVYTLINSGKLRACRINKRNLRVHRDWLREFCEQRLVAA